ncbi:uncharacterized protein BDV17DRAFT_127027 [Aspergillus undulatus]|uniref:uncharacterized protein n=1 Tax=Aspergillus undulatus TaxID=1810928 RepID=UPI003CCE4A84
MKWDSHKAVLGVPEGVVVVALRERSTVQITYKARRTAEKKYRRGCRYRGRLAKAEVALGILFSLFLVPLYHKL